MSFCKLHQDCPHERAFDQASVGHHRQTNREIDAAIRYLLPRISDSDCVRLRRPMRRWWAATQAFLDAPICPLLDQNYAAAWICILAETQRSRRYMVAGLYSAIHHHIEALLKVIRPEEEHRHWRALLLLAEYAFPGTIDRRALKRRAEREARHA